MIEINNLSYEVQKPILKNVSLQIKENEIQGIVGASGVGKSTLLKIIAGFLDYSEGEVLFEKKKIVGPSQKLIAGYEDIQLVNQDFALDLYHTVRENIAVQAQHLSKGEREELIEELLELVELKKIENSKAHIISGGEKQRLAIVRALAKEPKFLLLDEPFSQLDVNLKARMTNYLLKLKKVRHTGMLLVTHNGKEAMAMCDQINFMKEGKILRTAAAEDFYFHPKNEYEASFFGEINKVNIGSKKVLFRPNEYILERNNGETAIEVTFDHAVFQGNYFANYFRINRKRQIVLYHSKELENVTRFWINQSSIV